MTRKELLEKIGKIKAEISQLLQDEESWCENHPDEERLDAEFDFTKEMNDWLDAILNELSGS